MIPSEKFENPRRTTVIPPTTTTAPTTTTTLSPFAPPEWLGTRVLPLGPDGENGIVEPTPAELQGRAFLTESVLELADDRIERPGSVVHPDLELAGLVDDRDRGELFVLRGLLRR